MLSEYNYPIIDSFSNSFRRNFFADDMFNLPLSRSFSCGIDNFFKDEFDHMMEIEDMQVQNPFKKFNKMFDKFE